MTSVPLHLPDTGFFLFSVIRATSVYLFLQKVVHLVSKAAPWLKILSINKLDSFFQLLSMPVSKRTSFIKDN